MTLALAERATRTYLEDLLTQAANDWRVIPTFRDLLDRTLLEARAIAHLESIGCRIILSLDLCELLDISLSITSQLRRLPPNTARKRLRARQILSDIIFSRSALEHILLRETPFTILPATAAEIGFYLRDEFSHNFRLLHEHAIFAGDFEARSSTPLLNPLAFSSLEEFVRSEGPRVAATDRLVQYLTALFESRGFLPPSAVRGAFAVDEELYAELVTNISAIRQEGPVPKQNTVIDALNVASAVSASQPDQVVLHMTRTAALHQLSRHAPISYALAIKAKTRDDEHPIIVHPASIYLLDLLTGSSLSARSENYEVVEAFSRFWANLSSHLREYELALQTGRPQSKRVQEHLFQTYEYSEDYRLPFSQLMDSFYQNVCHGEQILAGGIESNAVDATLQTETLKERLQQSSALARQKRIATLIEFLSEISCFPHARSTIGTGIRLMGEPFLAQSLGLFVGNRTQPGSSLQEFFLSRRRVDQNSPLTPSLVLGLQLMPDSSLATVFWPSIETPATVLKALASLLLLQEPRLADEIWWLAVREDGSILTGRADPEDLSRSVSRDLGPTPLQALRLETTATTVTVELTMPDRPALTSITIDRAHLLDTCKFCQSAGTVLPIEVIRDFLERSLRAPFTDE